MRAKGRGALSTGAQAEGHGVHAMATDHRHAYELARRAFVEQAMDLSGDFAEQHRKRALGPCQRRELLNDITSSARDYAITSGVDLDDFKSTMLFDAGQIVEDITSALRRSWEEQAVHLDPWRHEKDPISLIATGQAPYMFRDSAEEAATKYLRLPYRSPLVERALVDILVALEVYAFGNEMLKPIRGYVPQLLLPPLQQRHAVINFFLVQLSSAIVLLGLAFVANNYLPALAGRELSHWLSVIPIIIWLAILVIGMVALPLRWWHQSKWRRKIKQQLAAILNTYMQLDTNGAVSARHIREMASKAAEIGVVWPGPLFAVLDDNIRRGGTL